MRKSVLRSLLIAAIALLICGVDYVNAGSAYSDGRAYLRQGSPQNAGKVYVASNATAPAASAYKTCNTVQTSETTTPSASAQVEGEKKTTTYHFWAQANAGYKFTGWYNSNGVLQGSGAEHISASVTSGQAGGSDTHAYLDMHASFIKIIQMSFIVPTNGSFDIEHAGSAVSNYASFTLDGKVVLTAHPGDGYKLRGWYTSTNGGATKSYFAFGNTCEPNFTSNVTIGAEFVPDDGKATFWNKNLNKIYDDLNTANSNANSGNIIVVVSDGTVTGTNAIKAGVTLLIPYNETYNLMTTPNVKHIASPSAADKAPTVFRKLTLASGAVINCSGNICIGGSIASVNGGQPSSFPTGPVGMLDMSRGGTINLKSGGKLYAWGYVKGQDMDQGNNTTESGVGSIVAESGSEVWEDYQVGEWRGGTASSTIYSNKTSWKFFPFQSYTIQNIEAPVTYNSGSVCKCYWAIFGNGQTFTVSFPLIASSDALFKLSSGATIKKWYDPTTDHVCFELGGTAALDALKLSVMGESVSSADYNLPIPANLKIILGSGNTLSLAKPMTVHAGAVVEVKSGATLNVNSKVYLYDKDDWDTYCMYAYYYRTYYSPSLHFNRGTGTTKDALVDATVIVDGTVNVGAQNLYATAHGASIIGNGGGTFKYNTLPANTTMTQCKVLSDNVSVNIRSANLKNDNESFTKGIASTTFKNVNGRWFTNAASTIKSNKTYDFTYIKTGDVYGTGGTDATVSACYSKDKTGLEIRDKWANIKADACDNWWQGIDDGYLYNWTMSSAWHQFIKTSTTIGSGDDAMDVYSGSNNKLYTKKDCEISEFGGIDANCLYTIDGVKKALIGGSFVQIEKNSDDEAYHKVGAATTYYISFDGCNWHSATKVSGKSKAYTVEGTVYIWYGSDWLAVQNDATVGLYYSLSSTNVKIYYDYVGSAWTLATPVAEVVTSAGTEQVYALATAITKAKAGGTNVTIRLLKDISITSAFTYDGANNCGLDLNGYTFSGTVTSMITVNNASATFIVKDQSAAGTGKIQAKFSRSDNKVYGINVTKGHFVLNSGTIHIENTHASQGSCGVVIKSGHKFTINGGRIESVSKGESWGVYTESSTTSVVNINGGTIETTTTSTSAAVSGIYSLGGQINISGGTVTASTTSSNTVKGVNLYNGNSTLNITGGTVTASAPSTVYGVYVTAGSTANISGGTINGTTTAATARGVISYGTTTISGGTINATAGSSDARAVFVANNTTTINAGATVNATANSNARALYYGSSTPTVTVNGGTFTARTLSTTGAYGIYAEKGTGTVNDGTFNITAKTTDAYGMYVTTADTPKLTVNGGKFMVKNSNGSANGTINNTGATLANFAMAGGYYNVAPNGTTNIAAGKLVKDLDATVEASLISAGYTKKIAGQEYTVTWKNRTGTTTLRTEKVESGKRPVWTGDDPVYTDGWGTYEFRGWTTEANNAGTYYSGELPVIGASDVTYFASYRAIYAELTTGGTTTKYYDVNSAWTAAMACQQATLRFMSSPDNLHQLIFSPTPANAIITIDMNGYHWGMNGTYDSDKDCFIKVNKAGCKLILTDNSTSGNGYIRTKWAKASNLICVQVTAGECLLQGGAIKSDNTYGDYKPDGKDYYASYNSVGVQIAGANAVFSMTGGTVEVTKTGDATKGTASGIYAYTGTTNLSGGRIYVHYDNNQAIGVYTFQGSAGVANLSGNIVLDITGNNSVYGIHGYGVANIEGGTYNITASGSTARGIYPIKSGSYSGKVNVTGNPVFTISSLSSACGAYSYNSGTEVNIDGGTFNVLATGGSNSWGVGAADYGTLTVKSGDFDVSIGNASYEQCWGAYANTNGTVNVEGGTFTLTAKKTSSNDDCARCNIGADTRLNISGGTFTMTNGWNAIRSMGGKTKITGNPVFTARSGVNAGTWASATGTAEISIDGGTFICTAGAALVSKTHTYNGNTVTGDITVWDGRFFTQSGRPIDTSSGTSYLKIRGGYYSSYTSSNVSELNGYVVSPSTTEAYSTTIDGKAYTYRVNTKYNVTFSVNGVNTVKQYNRNETPSYGSTPSISDGNTYEFVGWSPEIAPVTTDVTYTAVFKKYEAEIIIPGAATSKRYEHFTDAWTDVLQIETATIRLLSDVNLSTQVQYNPAPPTGSVEGDLEYFTNATTTLDLNNHTLAYTGTADRFVIVKKKGSKLIIDDKSSQGTGKIKHEKTSSASVYNVLIENGEVELTGGTIYTKNNQDDDSWHPAIGVYTSGTLNAIFTMTGGKIDNYSKKNSYAIYNYGVSNLRGGEVKSTDNSRGEAGGIRALNNIVNISADVVFTINSEQRAYAVNAEGQVNASTATQYGAVVTIDGGTFNVYGKTRAEGLYVNAAVATTDNTNFYFYEGDATVNSGTFNVRGENGEIFGIHNYRGVILGSGTPHPILKEVRGNVKINGGTFNVESAKDGSGNYTGTGNVEGVRNYGNMTISGGTINVKSKQNPIGLRTWMGKLIVEGNPTINVTAETVTRGITIADYAAESWCGLDNKSEVLVSGGTFNIKSTAGNNAIGIYLCGTNAEGKGNYAVSAIATVNGGEFQVSATQYGGTATYTSPVAVVGTQTKDNRLSINGGKFKLLKEDLTTFAGTNVNGSPSTTQVVLKGGYYNISNQLDTYKSSETQKTNITSASVDPEYTNGYRYKLTTPYTVSWRGGVTYSKDETVQCGTTPTNTECTSFVATDGKTYYFTNWTPTPGPIYGDVTYEAEGTYYEAKVKIGTGAWTKYVDFLDAWNVVQANANCTIALLNNVTLADKILYKPTVANGRAVFDLNNFTLTAGGSVDRLLEFNKADAILTITDGSTAKGGTLSITRTSAANVYNIVLHSGELIMAGGKIYSENKQNDSNWHPVSAVYVINNANALLTVTGGTIQAEAKYVAYTVYAYGTVNISGGEIKAKATGSGTARCVEVLKGTTTISGSAVLTSEATSSATAVAADCWMSNDGLTKHEGTVNITGGTFNVTASNQSAGSQVLYISANAKYVNSTAYAVHGTANVSGGTFNATSSVTDVQQLFCVVVNRSRVYTDATPHVMTAESKGVCTISGGTFTLETKNGSTLIGKGNDETLRSWGTLNVSGGTFNSTTKTGSTGIRVFGGKTTVSGNPTFNITGETGSIGISLANWCNSSYCDADIANNKAELEMSGGTFNVSSTASDANANGCVVARSTTSDVAGYALEGHADISGGSFNVTAPFGACAISTYTAVTATGSGFTQTSTPHLTITGGKFKVTKTGSASGSWSANIGSSPAASQVDLQGGFFNTQTNLDTYVQAPYYKKALTSDDAEYSNGYRYQIDVAYQAKVTVGAVEQKYILFRDAFEYAKTQNNAKITLLRDIDYSGLNFMYNPSSAYSCTLDLNGFTFKGAVSGHTGDASYNNDRLLVINKAGATFTIKDSSEGKTGKFSHEKSGAGFSVIVYHGTFVLESGTVHCKNTSSGSAQAVRSENYSDAFVSITGGKSHAEAAGTAYGLNTYNKSTVSGGVILAESSGGSAYGVNSQGTNGDADIKGTAVIKANASSTAYGAQAAGGGKLTISENACDTATSLTAAARGAYVENGQLFVRGNAIIRANAGTSSYGVYAASTNSTATIEGGTITSYSSANNASLTLYANTGANVTVSGGTLNATCIAGASNVSPTRTGVNATLTIDGGTFNGTGFQAVSLRGGTTTINGGTFTAATGIRAMDWADTETITAKCTVNGGTFNTTGVTIFLSSKANNSRNAHSEVTINGGKFKSTGSTIVQMDAVPSGADPSTLTITGGYFNEKSGTTFKTQLANFVSDPYEIFTLETGDPEIANGYSYLVCQKRVAKVTESGGARTYYTTVKAALDYFKTKNNATLTMLRDDSYTGRYTLTPTISNWRGTWDLNNKAVTCTSASYGMFDLNKADAILTITDNSADKGGCIEHVEAAASTAVWGINIENGQVILQAGTIRAYNTQASATSTKVGISVKNANSGVTMTGGKVETVGYANTYGFNITGGTVSISGGAIKAQSEYPSGTYGTNAYGIYLAAGTTGTSNVTISGTPTVDVTASQYAYGITNSMAGATDNISGGTFTVTAHTNYAYGISNTAATTINVSNASFTVDATTGQEAYGVYAKNANAKVVTENTTYEVTAKTKIAYALAAYNSANIEAKSGTFNATSDGTRADGLHIESSATATIKNGTFTMTSNGTDTYAIEAQNNPGTITIEGGTFTTTTKTNAGADYWNVESVRIWGSCPSTVINISGGTFSVTNKSAQTAAAYGIRTYSGTVNVSGTPTFNAQYAVYIANQYVSNHTAYVNISGGTFNSARTCITAQQVTSGDNVNKADVTITGGKFKSAGGYSVLTATNTSNLKLQGGYYSNNANNTMENYCVSPKHAVPTTTADKSAVGSDYNWKVVDAYTLTWVTDGDALTGTYTKGITAVGASITPPNTPTKTGYTFASWTPAPVAAVMPAANTTYTATWTANTYYVRFNKNNSNATGTMSNETFTYGTSKALTSNGFSRIGYTFAGWATTADGEVVYTNGQSVSNLSAVNGATVDLYATWNCVSPTSLTIASTGNKWDFCAGETMTLTVSGSNIAADATYQWKLGGTNIAGATSATYTTTMAAAKAGAYTCTVTNGTCSATTSDTYVRVWQLYINNGSSDAWQTLDFANTAASTGNNTTVALTSDKNYLFKLKDNTGGWFGLNSKTVTRTESAFALNGTGGNVTVQSGMAGNYTFTINYSDKNHPTIAITYPTANQPAGRDIYFDKSVITGWTSESAADIFLRIGKPSNNKNNVTDSKSWTLVPGTDRFYTIKTLAYDGFEAWQIANNASWTGNDRSIYLVNTGDQYAITKATNFQKYVVGESGVTIVPTTSNNTENGCNYWNVAVTDGMLKHTATITTPEHGTIMIANAAQSLSATATTANLPHRTILTVTATPASGYKLGTLTVNGVAISSGDTHILAADATIAATFAPESVGEWFDIADWTSLNEVVVNTNGYSSATAKSNWTIRANGKTYTKSNREEDRTLKVDLAGLGLAPDGEVVIEGLGTESVLESYHKYIVPHIYDASATLSGTGATSIVYVHSGTLTVNSNLTVGRIYVCPGAKLVINSGKTLTVKDRLVMRTHTKQNVDYRAPELVNNGTLTFDTGAKMYYSRIVADNTQLYPIGFPYEVTLANVELSSGKPAVRGTHYALQYYDSERRALYGADGGNWDLYEGATMVAKTGYLLLSTSKYYYEYMFPVIYNKSAPATVSVKAYPSANAGDAGWNMCVSPFTSTSSITSAVPSQILKVSKLYEDNVNYYQDAATNLEPAVPFYMQVDADATLNFSASGAGMRRRAHSVLCANSHTDYSDNTVQEQWIRLSYSESKPEEQKPMSDITNIFLHPSRFTAEYETGVDVIKMSKTGARPFIYTTLECGDLAFTAVPDETAEAGIPLTVWSPVAGDYTFSLEKNNYLERLDHLWLVDALYGDMIDLLENDYTIDVAEGTTAGRFSLMGMMRSPEITTGVENQDGDGSGVADGAEKPRKIYRDGYMYILMPNGDVYSIGGKKTSLK